MLGRREQVPARVTHAGSFAFSHWNESRCSAWTASFWWSFWAAVPWNAWNLNTANGHVSFLECSHFDSCLEEPHDYCCLFPMETEFIPLGRLNWAALNHHVLTWQANHKDSIPATSNINILMSKTNLSVNKPNLFHNVSSLWGE